MTDRDLDILTRCCGHVESAFLDREFVLGRWSVHRARALRALRRARGEQAFRRILKELVEGVLPLSHCRLVTPELGAAIRHRAEGEIPRVLMPTTTRIGDVLYLRLASFSLPPFCLGEMKAALEGRPAAKTLVLDMRLNAGGSSCAAGEFLGLLLGPDVHYLTSRLPDWRASRKPVLLRSIPEAENPGCVPELDALSGHRHAEWRTRTDSRRMFHGRVLLLVGERTGSCGELVAQVLKTSPRTTVLGEPTAGACVGAREYDCGHGYAVMLPFVWLLAPGPVRIEGRPVRPHRRYSSPVPDGVPLPPAEVVRLATSPFGMRP